jgi:hemerythrin-like domain-containing protein
MKSVERLKAEHDLIERGLALLEKSVARLEAGQSLPEGFPQWAPRFFQQFADRCHHAKEEDVFFPVLKQRGIPEQGGPIGVMLHEHGLGRDCVGRMREASQALPFDARTFADAARQYIPLLRQHIFKENNVLFHMAERVMSGADDADVANRFSQVERDRGLTGLHESYANDVAGWEATLESPRQAGNA